ncbi:hypothetical protein GOP47_0005264 [Adiantum capillus-veneris]|uniref:Uncharacterized protein n=1 Tax=Adiantum capillus-veneris TaxID=13818 RepID=A0A9D4V4S6_ADICA|nr:hypothetical protein GOP47_0005264 [Adiantum capillus-veneris]
MPRRQREQRSRSSASKRTPQKGGAPKKPKKAAEEDDFFDAVSDEELLSSDADEVEEDTDRLETQSLDETKDDNETADEKRLRAAKAYLEEIRASTKELEADGHDDSDVDDEAKRREALGARDSLVADLLQQAQLEESGRAQRKLAARIVKPDVPSLGMNVGRRHRQSVTAVALSEDDSKGFAASKDGLIVHWDVETGSRDKYIWPSKEGLASSVNGAKMGVKGKQKPASKNTLALAVSSDGRYLATGGLDRMIHLWDTRTREHLQAFPGHRGAVSSLVFRQGTQQLMSASFDRTIKLWSVEDRAYMDTLFGHQSEVLTIDCLRQERVLSAGRDRTMRLWKIPDETQLVFRGHAASMECCCFLTNTEFLSGSDDGCVALWNVMKKKPLALMRNVHGVIRQKEGGPIANSNSDICGSNQADREECYGNGNANHDAGPSVSLQRNIGVEAWVGAIAVCRGSDLVASGAGDGQICLWAVEEDNRNLQMLHMLPTKGFVNSIAFAKSGRFLIAGVGQEPRLGRWGRNPHARNGVVLHNLIPY